MKDINIYIAGSLFTEAEVKQRKLEQEWMESLIERVMTEKGQERVTVFNPINNPFNDKSTLPTARDIVKGDTEQISKSDYILLNLDNQLDAGVFVELGQIAGLALETNKKVFAVISDSRFSTAGEYNKFEIPIGINQYVIGALQEIGAEIHDESTSAIYNLVAHIIKDNPEVGLEHQNGAE